ncbi:permease [Sinanaerobacter chloroacetimidivorans]|uniref:Permease n=1 Tax=Sinanaerobacter chloroacetimidivorans TaxID=2818044 RepID=A0A8J8B1B9_9FIRM|nr:permease [Sinanaerobacter chloroacetimidivorans]MBR0598568.1 permease [Sinanaerobacter chloroacetimidivorans]
MLEQQMKLALAEFWHVGWILVVLIAGISVLTGFVREYIPQEKFQQKLKNQNTVSGAIMGAMLGILTPFCSASMVPVAMGMIEMSAPFTTVLPFLISAPLTNFVVVGVIFGTFGWKIAVIYFLWVFGGAITAGLTIGRSRIKYQVKNLAEIAEEKRKGSKSSCGCGSNQNTVSPCSTKVERMICSEPIIIPCGVKEATEEPLSCSGREVITIGSCNQTQPITCSESVSIACTENEEPNEVKCCSKQVVAVSGCSAPAASANSCSAPAVSSGDHGEKARNAFRFASALFKQITPYAILGAAISGITLAFVPSTIVETYVGNGSWYAIPIAAAIGVPLYLRIEMAIPLLGTLLAKGMSMGAAMALLIGGTGASLPELAILSSMLKPKGVIAFALTIFTLATTGGILFMLII